MHYALPLSPPEPTWRDEFDLDTAPEDDLRAALDAADDRGDFALMADIKRALSWRFPEDDL